MGLIRKQAGLDIETKVWTWVRTSGIKRYLRVYGSTIWIHKPTSRITPSKAACNGVLKFLASIEEELPEYVNFHTPSLIYFRLYQNDRGSIQGFIDRVNRYTHVLQELDTIVFEKRGVETRFVKINNKFVNQHPELWD